jgi:dolichol-phosphate mannosyltransferase
VAELDIVIPVYNEGGNIVPVLDSFHAHVKTPYRVFIVYDFDEDDTLPAVADYPPEKAEIVLLKNPGRGPNKAMIAGLEQSTAPFVLTHMADDDFNSDAFDLMVEKIRGGADIVTGSRFMRGGCMIGCRWYKKLITQTASLSLHYVGRLPVHDATNAFRMFSRRVLDTIEIESTEGFNVAFELLVKAVRLGWRVEEVPARWYERRAGESRFRILDWIPPYFRWYRYHLATMWLRRGPETVRRLKGGDGAPPAVKSVR